MKKKLALVLIIPVLLSGCWDQKIYERIGFILNVGIESSPNGELLVTYTSPVVGQGKKGTEVELLQVTAGILREARGKARTMSAKQLEAGKIQQILISSEIAQKQGVHELLEVFERDPASPIQNWVAIVDGSPNKLLKAAINFKNKPRPSIYLNQLLEDNAINSRIPQTRIVNYDIAYFAQGLDPMLPIIKLSGKNVSVTGTALFSEDKMTGRLSCKQTFLALSMMGAVKPEYTYVNPLPPNTANTANKKMETELTLKKRKIDIKIENGKPLISIYLLYDGYVGEYPWDELNKGPVKEQVETFLSKNLKKECKKTIALLQEAGCDPIGIGDMVRAKYNNYFNSVVWKDVYKNAAINVDTTVKISRYGTND